MLWAWDLISVPLGLWGEAGDDSGIFRRSAAPLYACMYVCMYVCMFNGRILSLINARKPVYDTICARATASAPAHPPIRLARRYNDKSVGLLSVVVLFPL